MNLKVSKKCSLSYESYKIQKSIINVDMIMLCNSIEPQKPDLYRLKRIKNPKNNSSMKRQF